MSRCKKLTSTHMNLYYDKNTSYNRSAMADPGIGEPGGRPPPLGATNFFWPHKSQAIVTRVRLIRPASGASRVLIMNVTFRSLIVALSVTAHWSSLILPPEVPISTELAKSRRVCVNNVSVDADTFFTRRTVNVTRGHCAEYTYSFWYVVCNKMQNNNILILLDSSQQQSL